MMDPTRLHEPMLCPRYRRNSLQIWFRRVKPPAAPEFGYVRLQVMQKFPFGEDTAFTPLTELLEGVTVSPLSASLQMGASVQAAVFRVAANGRIVRHAANVPQILAVFAGSGRVSGADGEFQEIAAGEAVFWHKGEQHETETDTGLTVLILEAEGLEPPRLDS